MSKPEQDGQDAAALASLLAGLPRPQLPPEVATRLDAAIARAVAERVSTSGGSTIPAPQRASYAPRRPRLRLLTFGSAAAACLVLILGVVFALHLSGSSGGSTANSAAGSGMPDLATLSTAPVTDPTLLTWAALALKDRSGPLAAHNGGAAQPGFTPLTVPGSTAGPAAPSCVLDRELTESGVAQRQLLSAASGEYHGRSAILLAYSNGTDDSTALIVVFAAPCTGANSSVLTSGVVPR
jgi:hypothetical protein